MDNRIISDKGKKKHNPINVNYHQSFSLLIILMNIRRNNFDIIKTGNIFVLQIIKFKSLGIVALILSITISKFFNEKFKHYLVIFKCIL